MNALLSLRQQIADNQRRIASYERAIANDPGVPSLTLALRSAVKHQESLEGEFQIVAASSGLDVCRYRMISEEGGSYRVATLGNALVAFQSLITAVYDAIVNKPKSTGKIAADVVEKTAFEFGFSFAGSVGFVLTMPNERLLLTESDLDAAFDGVFQMAKENDAAGIRRFAEEYGVASIRALKRWAHFHSEAYMNADVKWVRGDTIRRSVLVQHQELRHLEAVLASRSETVTERLSLVGELRGADVIAKTFRMHFESGLEIKGHFDDAIDESHRVRLPMRYRADLVKMIRSASPWEDDEVTYFLERLSDPVAAR